MKYFRDTYAEHPDDRQNIEYSVFLDGDDALVTLSGMYEQMKQHGFNLTYARCVCLSSSSVTRFDEISPLWQNILRLWQKFYVIGLNFFVVNGQTLNSYLAIWSLCDFIEFILITSDLFWYPSTSFDILRPLLISSDLFWYPSTSFDIFWPLLKSVDLFQTSDCWRESSERGRLWHHPRSLETGRTRHRVRLQLPGLYCLSLIHTSADSAVDSCVSTER